MLALDPHIVNRSTRIQALGLLCAVIRHQPPYLYTVSQTPVIEHLLKCLMIDTSHTVISLALTTLLMFLPHIPSSVVAHLPRLFLIYSRLLCWEHLYPVLNEDEQLSDPNDNIPSEEEVSHLVDKSDWEQMKPFIDGGDVNTPELGDYFTFLYGLYPLNLMSYVRKPRKYLKNINFPRADEFDLDQDVIRLRTEQFQRVHLLHPNFYNTTAEDELTDDIWLKSDPADVIAQCMGLCLIAPVSLNEPVPPPSSKLPDVPPAFIDTDDIPPQALLSCDDDGPITNVKNTSEPKSARQKSRTNDGHASPLLRARTEGIDSTTLSPIMRSPRRELLSPILGNVSTFSPLADVSPKLPQSAVQPSNLNAQLNVEGDIGYLQREVLLLRNDLNFERYLKQQHILHIGQLQRQHMKEATIETDTVKLINNNRALKAKLAKANDIYTLLKKETANDRANHRKRENEQNVRMRMLRDTEHDNYEKGLQLGDEITKFKVECDQLKQLVVQSEAKELLSQQKMAVMVMDLEQLHSMRSRITELEELVRMYEKRDLAFEEAKHDRETLRTELAAIKLRVQTHSAGDDNSNEGFTRRIVALEQRLREAQNAESTQNAAVVQHRIDSAVATLTARYSALRKEYANLNQRYGDVKIRCEELEQDARQSPAAHQAGWSTDQVDDDETEDDDHSSLAPSRLHSSGDSPYTHSPALEPVPPRYQVPLYAAGTISPPTLRLPPDPTTTTGGAPLLERKSASSSTLGHESRTSLRMSRTSSQVSVLSQQKSSQQGVEGDTRPRGGLYASDRSAFSTESLAASNNSDQTRGSSSMFTRAVGKDKETAEERRKREKRDKGLAKTGGFRGIRGIM